MGQVLSSIVYRLLRVPPDSISPKLAGRWIISSTRISPHISTINNTHLDQLPSKDGAAYCWCGTQRARAGQCCKANTHEKFKLLRLLHTFHSKDSVYLFTVGPPRSLSRLQRRTGAFLPSGQGGWARLITRRKMRGMLLSVAYLN